MPDYPCWLSQKDLYIAQALIDKSGFVYIGKEDDFIIYDEELGTGYQLAKSHGWRLASAYGEVALEAIRDGAIFAKNLESLPGIDFEKEVKTALQIVKMSAKNWEVLHPPSYEQLSLEWNR